MTEITRDVRDELRSALKRVGVPKEVVAVVKRITDSEQLHAALDSLGVGDEVLSMLKSYRSTLTDGEVIEVLQSLCADPQMTNPASVERD